MPSTPAGPIDHSDAARPGRLVLVATPIGNLDDLSPRAAAVLAGADVVAAEDTRRTRVLLDHIGAATPTVSYHDHNERTRSATLLDRVARGETVALVSDAGTPGLADPGFVVVREAIARGLAVEAVPGPNALLHALVVSGLPMDRFTFEGFLPRKSGARAQRLRELADEPRTMVFYIPPHRAADEIAALRDALGERPAALARELTKLHEEVRRGTLAQLAQDANGLRGEITLVVAGHAVDDPTPPESEDLVGRVRELVATGVARKDAIATVARAAGVPKRVVYQALVDAAADEPGRMGT